MAIKAELLPGEPIVIVTIVGAQLEMSDPVDSSNAFLDLTKDIQGIRVRIVDLSGTNLNFGDIVHGLSVDAALKDERSYTIFVGLDELIHFGTKAASEQSQYGHMKVAAYPDMDQALAAARTVIAEGGI